MEFAYPGVGILAGDSIQYLSIATAHGVIMVFFMIMPAIFGAFGNFLLPTQLGVHDVAFPRLNSAAFWFLPGGLIMLCQLVCVDRRYQRMNCFNIRELQGILKRKFFTDLVNTTDSHKATDSTLIGMRHKNNMSNILLYDQSLLYNFDITSTSKFKNFTFTPGKVYSYSSTLNTSLQNTLTIPNHGLYLNMMRPKIYLILTSLLKDIVNFFSVPTLTSAVSLHTSFGFILNSLSYNLYFALPNPIQSFMAIPTKTTLILSTKNDLYTETYNSSVTNFKLFNSSMPYSLSENSSSWRFNRYSYPLISYDYKSGNYYSIWDQLYPALSVSFIEIARGIRKAP
jgi:hypothetical protein